MQLPLSAAKPIDAEHGANATENLAAAFGPARAVVLKRGEPRLGPQKPKSAEGVCTAAG